MTLDEYLAEYTVETLNMWEVLGISFTVFIGIIIVCFAVCEAIKHKDRIREIINALRAYDDDD